MRHQELSPEWKERRAETVEESQRNTTKEEVVAKIKELGYTLDQYCNINMQMFAGETRDKVFSIIAAEKVNLDIGDVKS